MNPYSNTRLIVFCIVCGTTVLLLTRFILGSNDSSKSTVKDSPPSANIQNGTVNIQSPHADKEKEGLMEYSNSPLALAIVNLRAARGLPGSENLDIEKCVGTLNEWAAHIKKVTDSQMHQFNANPAKFNNSEAYFKMLVLKTVLAEDLKVKYKPELSLNNPSNVDLADFSYAKDSKDIFLHGLLSGNREGTCASLPVLVTVLGRILGYPLKLVPAKTHMFVRWEDARERLNIEATSPGLLVHPDEHYRHWPYEISDEEMAQGYYLKSLSTQQEIAICMSNLSVCLMANDRYFDALVQLKQVERLESGIPHIGGMIKSLQKFLDNEMKKPYAKKQLATRDVLSRLDRQEFREKITLGCEFDELESKYPVTRESKSYIEQKNAILNGITLKYSRRKAESKAINELRVKYGLDALGSSDSKIVLVSAMERDQREAAKEAENPKAPIENMHWQDILDIMKSDVVIAGSLEIIVLYKETDRIIEEYRAKGNIDGISGKDVGILSKEVDDLMSKFLNDIDSRQSGLGYITISRKGQVKEAE